MKSTLIKGTLILTIAGFACRILGFFYRIYLSKGLGAEGLGIYQMIFPVYSICFTIYASGIQTGVSQLLSERTTSQIPKRLIKTGLFLSIFLALCMSISLYSFADTISVHILQVPECGKLLKTLSFIFPICGITSVINGVFYGLNRAKVPAVTQMVEQIVRIGFVFVLTSFPHFSVTFTCRLAVLGLIAGEIASNIYNVYQLKKLPAEAEKTTHRKTSEKYIRKILSLSIPLSSTRLVIALLNSMETVMIPAMLVRYGSTQQAALSVYGIISGIVLPFILFPGAITNSLSVLLLPAISNANGRQDYEKIRITTQEAIKYTLLLGILFSTIFSLFGTELGELVFHSTDAGNYLVLTSCVCPFIYASTTLSSIINGLGKTHITFRNTVIGLSIRILCLAFWVPKFGIYGYLVGFLISQIFITILDGKYLYNLCHYHLEIVKWFVIPSGLLYLTGFLCKKTIRYIPYLDTKYSELLTISFIPVICILFYLFLRKQKII